MGDDYWRLPKFTSEYLFWFGEGCAGPTVALMEAHLELHRAAGQLVPALPG
jgi:hypothetical protein